jgi:hypothetical protein
MSDATVQAGHQYPEVVRIIKSGDTTGEYAWYDDPNWDGTPWPGTFNVTWVAPTERADGSALAQVDTYTLEYGGVDTVASPGILTTVPLAGDVLLYDIPTPEAGKTYRARISATTGGRTSQLGGFVYIVGA